MGPVQLLIAQSDDFPIALLNDGLGQYRFDGWIELLEDILTQSSSPQ